MAKSSISDSEPNLKKIALFWIGILLLVFALVINIFLIIMEIYPSVVYGIIIGLYTTAIGALSLFYAFRWNYYKFTDARTIQDKILFAIAGITAVISAGMIVIGITTTISAGMIVIGITTIVSCITALIAFFYIERENRIGSISLKVIGIIIAIMVAMFGITVGLYVTGWADVILLIIGIIPFIDGIVYVFLQFFESSPPSSSIPLTSTPVTHTDSISKRGFQLLLLFALYFVCAILIMCGVWQIFLALSIELVYLGYVLVSIGLIALIATVALTSFIILCNIASDESDRRKLGFLLLGITIGIFVGIFVGYLLFAYVIGVIA